MVTQLVHVVALFLLHRLGQIGQQVRVINRHLQFSVNRAGILLLLLQVIDQVELVVVARQVVILRLLLAAAADASTFGVAHDRMVSVLALVELAAIAASDVLVACRRGQRRVVVLPLRDTLEEVAAGLERLRGIVKGENVELIIGSTREVYHSFASVCIVHIFITELLVQQVVSHTLPRKVERLLLQLLELDQCLRVDDLGSCSHLRGHSLIFILLAR